MIDPNTFKLSVSFNFYKGNNLSILRNLYYRLSPEGRLLLRNLWYFPYDLKDKITGKKKLIPPRRMIYTGSGDFIAEGQRYLEHFKKLGQLQPKDCVLDIGSGIGRMAIPLTVYLSPDGTYHGFDIVEKGVDWCNRHISTAFPNFHFQHIALKNDLYSSTGNRAANFRFPYPDQFFDFCFATSVYTHLLPEEVENYNTEVHRVLKAGGRFLCTFFVLGSEEEVENPSFQFPVKEKNYRSMSASSRSSNVGYSMEYIQNELTEGGKLKVREIRKGYWRTGKKVGTEEFQDIIVFEKVL